METTTQGGSIYEQNVSEELDLSGQHAPMASHLLAENGADLQSDREENDSISTKDNKGEVNGMAWEDLNGEFQPEVMNMSREDCWMLIRRFNYMVFGVKATQDQPFGHLDMSIAKDTNTSPERLQAQLARLYMSVIIRLFALWKHLVRLRSWNEPRRTSAFLLVYIIAWVADLLVPTLFCFVSVLVLFPLSRPILFPFAPPSIIDAATGGVQKSPAGVMASESSVTAAPENHKGETIELEAQNFLSSFAKLIMRTTSEGGKDKPEDSPAPGLAKLSGKLADAKSKTDHEEKAPEDDDQTKEPMKHAIEDVEVQPLLNMLFDFIDTWERFANALNPSTPFSARDSRLLLSACLLLPALATSYLSRDAMMRGFQLGMGFAFFGRPLILRSGDFLNNHYPNWRTHCQLRHTILRDVPTNAQLTITILRAGERIKSPLAPSPVAHGAPKAEATITAESLLHLGATEEQIQEAIEPNTDVEDAAVEPTPKALLERFIGAIKRSSKRGVYLFHKVEKMKADHGNSHAQARLDIGQTTSQKFSPAGPLKFPACYKGTVGYVYIITDAISPYIEWKSYNKSSKTSWTIQIRDIHDLSKVDGMSFKTGQVVRWALDKEAVDGLVVTTSGGERFHLSAVVKRNEVFNRLIALGNQTWEVY